MNEVTLLLLLSGAGLVLAGGLIAYGSVRLRRILRCQREWTEQGQQSFAYEQYKLAAQASLAKAQRATDKVVRQEALRAGVTLLQRALQAYPQAPDSPDLQQHIEEWQRELEGEGEAN